MDGFSKSEFDERFMNGMLLRDERADFSLAFDFLSGIKIGGVDLLGVVIKKPCGLTIKLVSIECSFCQPSTFGQNIAKRN